MDTAEKEAKKLDEEITLIEIEIEKRNEILKSRISSYQENGGNIQYLEVFLGSKDFTEFISRLSAVTTITNADADLIAIQNNDKETVEARKKELQQKEAEMKDKKSKLQSKDGKLATLEEEIRAEMTENVSAPAVVDSNNKSNDSINNSNENSNKSPDNSPEVSEGCTI